MEEQERIKQLLEQYPFLSYLIYGGNEYIGIIQNCDEQITTLYDFGLLKDIPQKELFLGLGDQWWWESNRMIPINIFLRTEMELFEYALMSMNSKDVKVTIGPVVNLGNLSVKRIKRKSVQLVRRPPKD